MNLTYNINKKSKIYIAGHTGLVGSAIVRRLISKGYTNIITKFQHELDLRNQHDVEMFFKNERPEYLFLAAAHVGGIAANYSYPAEFIYNNLAIKINIINSAYQFGVKKLINLGSSCVYPRYSKQPIAEDALLSGALEKTNEAYAIAKIASAKMCTYYNIQYKTSFLTAMPTNLYGPNDNFNLTTSHVLPSLMRKIYLAKLLYESKYELIKKDLATFKLSSNNYDPIDESASKKQIENILSNVGINHESVILWGSGNPLREFLYVDDCADALVFIFENYNDFTNSIINVGTGQDISILDLANIFKNIIGFNGKLIFDQSMPDGTPRKILDITKLSRCGWKAKTKLLDGIQKTYNWYKEQINKTNIKTINNSNESINQI